MFRQARKWRWVSENPIELVDPPPLEEGETETLAAEDVARLLGAYRELAAGAADGDRHWIDTARRMTVVALSTGLRRGELLGLRWQDVELLERRLHVRQSFVRGEMTTPKSRAGRRVVHLGPHAVAALEEQFSASRYRASDSIVFGRGWRPGDVRAGQGWTRAGTDYRAVPPRERHRVPGRRGAR